MKLVGILLIVAVVAVAIFLSIPSAWNPITPKGEATGIFIDGGHHGFGDFCGDYPGSWIRLKNATWNPKHFHGENGNVNTYYGNQFKNIDEMEVGVRYKVWYHEESRTSDVSASNQIYYWVVDGVEKK